jgi:dolichol kinase
MDQTIALFHTRRELFEQSLEDLQEALDVWLAEQGRVSNQLKRSVEDYILNFEVRYLEYKEVINLLPKDIQKRPVMRQVARDVKRAEKAIRGLMPTLQDKRWKGAVKYAEHLKAYSHQLVNDLNDSDTLAMIDRFMEGETLLATRSVLQWGRKVFHMGMGGTAYWLYAGSGLSFNACMILFACFLGPALFLEYYRRHHPEFNKKACRQFKHIIREHEVHKVTAATLYMVSVYIVLWVFPEPVASLAFLFIVFGDPAASIAGSFWGKTKLGKNISLEGMAGCFAVCAVITLIATPLLMPSFTGSLLLFSILAGVIGAVAEISFPRWDDNLVIPLMSAPLLLLVLQLFS